MANNFMNFFYKRVEETDGSNGGNFTSDKNSSFNNKNVESIKKYNPLETPNLINPQLVPNILQNQVGLSVLEKFAEVLQLLVFADLIRQRQLEVRYLTVLGILVLNILFLLFLRRAVYKAWKNGNRIRKGFLDAIELGAHMIHRKYPGIEDAVESWKEVKANPDKLSGRKKPQKAWYQKIFEQVDIPYLINFLISTIVTTLVKDLEGARLRKWLFELPSRFKKEEAIDVKSENIYEDENFSNKKRGKPDLPQNVRVNKNKRGDDLWTQANSLKTKGLKLISTVVDRLRGGREKNPPFEFIDAEFVKSVPSPEVSPFQQIRNSRKLEKVKLLGKRVRGMGVKSVHISKSGFKFIGGRITTNVANVKNGLKKKLLILGYGFLASIGLSQMFVGNLPINPGTTFYFESNQAAIIQNYESNKPMTVEKGGTFLESNQSLNGSEESGEFIRSANPEIESSKKGVKLGQTLKKKRNNKQPGCLSDLTKDKSADSPEIEPTKKAMKPSKLGQRGVKRKKKKQTGCWSDLTNDEFTNSPEIEPTQQRREGIRIRIQDNRPN